jgi:hypothetical protein
MPEKVETTHFPVVDKWGNAVSNTYTINGYFGSGVVAEGRGIVLNDEMDDFDSLFSLPGADEEAANQPPSRNDATERRFERSSAQGHPRLKPSLHGHASCNQQHPGADKHRADHMRDTLATRREALAGNRCHHCGHRAQIHHADDQQNHRQSRAAVAAVKTEVHPVPPRGVDMRR